MFDDMVYYKSVTSTTSKGRVNVKIIPESTPANKILTISICFVKINRNLFFNYNFILSHPFL